MIDLLRFLKQLQEKANLLTAERKKRGKNVPKELLPSDDIRVFKPKASHPVSSKLLNYFLSFCTF